jgi:hypothetical protein
MPPKIAVISSKPLSELTSEEKKARWREMSQKARFTDQSKVVGEAHIHYFWAGNTAIDAAELIRLQNLGYEIVKEPSPKEVLSGTKQPKIVAAGLKEDGTYIRGDVILMQIPQEDYEFFLLDIEQRHENSMNSVSEDFRSEAELAGSPTFTVSK